MATILRLRPGRSTPPARVLAIVARLVERSDRLIAAACSGRISPATFERRLLALHNAEQRAAQTSDEIGPLLIAHTERRMLEAIEDFAERHPDVAIPGLRR